MKKSYILLLIFVLCLPLCACEPTNPEAPVVQENEVVETIDEYTGLSTVSFENLDGKFVAFQNIVQPHAFTQEGNTFSGNIVFTHGEASVPVSLVVPSEPFEENSVLTIAGQSLELSLPCPYGMDVVDLDIDDNRYEIAVYDEGMSADYSISLFSYIDGGIIALGTIGADKDAKLSDIGPCFGVALCDMHGTIIDPWYCVRLGEPGTVLQYNKLTQDGFITETPKTDIIGKTYTVENSFPCFFKPTDQVPEDYWNENVYFNEDYMCNTQKGDVFKILDGYRFEDSIDYTAYYVEYNGTPGVLFLMLGD